MVIKEGELLKVALDSVGLDKEIGWENGGFYTPTEMVDNALKHVDADDLGLGLSGLVSLVNPNRAHELLHCFDVAIGSAELVNVMQEEGIDENRYFPHTTRDAFLAGIFHDLVLGYDLDALNRHISFKGIHDLVREDFSWPFQAGLYLKGPMEDDLFGADLVKTANLGSTDSSLFVAVVSAAPHDILAVEHTKIPLLQKVLDAIWYHDGNYPLRGFAESGMLIRDRVRLYTKHDRFNYVNIWPIYDGIKQGIDKMLDYIAVDPGWEERSQKPDHDYLLKKIEKKAPGFMEGIKGTRTYDFVVEDLASRGRSLRTLRSPAFIKGVFEYSTALVELDKIKCNPFNPEDKIKRLHDGYTALTKMLEVK